jgi:hypothetical protein
MSFPVRIKTRMSYEEIEDVVQRDCKGAFEISFEGVEEQNGITRKVMSITFATESDRDAFRAALGKK